MSNQIPIGQHKVLWSFPNRSAVYVGTANWDGNKWIAQDCPDGAEILCWDNECKWIDIEEDDDNAQN